MSKRKTTKGKKKKRKRRKKPKLIKTRGIGLSVKLFKHDLSMSASSLASLLRSLPYSPKGKDDIDSGFVKVKARGKNVTAEFVSGFRVPILSYNDSGDLVPVHYVSVDRGTAIIKMDRGTIEFRGSQRIANKFRSILEDQTGGNMSPLNLNGGTKKLYDSAADIASVLLTEVERGNITQAEFRGLGIKSEAEIGLYTRKYKGHISRFRGTFPYPSGAFLTTSINAEAGSIMVYKSGDGILEKDLDYIVDLMETAAIEQDN